MNFREIFRFEILYQLRHASTWLLFAAFFLFGFAILRMVTIAGGTHLNAPATIAFFTVFGSAIWVVIGGVIAGDAATRDRQTGMHPLTYTTPVSKLTYLGARFLVALTLNALIMLILYAGFLLSYYGPGAKTQFLAPFRLESFLTNFGFLALPTVIATTAIQFCFAALSGRAIASYIASIFIILFSQFGGTTVRYLLEWKVLGILMDLLGTSIVAGMEGWTPLDKNTRLVLLEGTWLWNRVVWCSIAVAALAFTYFRFRFAHIIQHVGWMRLFSRMKHSSLVTAKSNLPDVRDHSIRSFRTPDITRDFAFLTYASQVHAIARASFHMIAANRGGLTLVAALAIGTGLFATEYMEWLGVPLLARTEEVLRILAPPLNSFRTQWITIPLLTIFFAGELVWRERESDVNELTDTAPVPEWVMFSGKFVGLALVIFVWLVFLLIAGIINQFVMNYHSFEIGVYMKGLFGIQLTNYLLFALLVLAIHVAVNQKYVGHMLACCVYGFILFASAIGVEHKLLIYASDTGWSYSDMRGFGPFIKPWLWFKFYWASWAFLLAVLAALFWVRSKEEGLKARIQLAKHRFMRHKTVTMLAVALVVLSGSFIFYNTNILNAYLTKQDRMERRAKYEHRYSQYEHTTQPVLARVKSHVEIYPEEHTADIQATILLINRSKAAIDSIHLSTVPRGGISEIAFDRNASAAWIDNDLGYRIYALLHPLRPGDSVNMSFKIRIGQHGFSNDGVDASVVANGTYITNDDWMPIIGYHQSRRLHNTEDREKYGLAPRREAPSLYDIAARKDTRHAEQIYFETVLGTRADQIAIAPGALQRSWFKGGTTGKGTRRRYFHYATHAPILNESAFFSAKYAIREAQWAPSPRAGVMTEDETREPVSIQIFYHPAHSANVERMVKSVQASLEYYSREFGPYPYRHFRVLERPGPGRGMHAAPMTIDYEEGYSLMNPSPESPDLPYHIMAHEVAHQWWGIHLVPAAVEGAGLLVESLATYAAMQVVEETLGYEHLLRYLSQMRMEYEVPHSRAAPPLLRANNAFLVYRKGPFALYALRNYIGKAPVNDALRRVLQNYPASPYTRTAIPSQERILPTTLDLYRELQRVTPDSLQYLVRDLFAANTFWELRTELATAKQTDAGTWQVTLEVEARKVTVDSIGVERRVPMQDWIEIGVYAPRAAGENSSRALYLQKHLIGPGLAMPKGSTGPGTQTITLNVSEQPERVGIDPNYLMIDLNPGNNTRKVTIIEADP